MDTTVEDSNLSKIRALLAKAESTTFEPEADALTAKAQALMTKHRIDAALLAASDPAHNEANSGVDGRTVYIAAPYASAKSLLLAVVADANGARVVWDATTAVATVVGPAVDLGLVEELFTSLLVQATAAMGRHGSKFDGTGRSRTRSFRHAFLTSFGVRIGERLQEAAAAVVAAEDAVSREVLPVLAAQDAAVDKHVARLFPRVRSRRITVSDPEGVHAGRMHADQADLSVGAPLDR